MRLIALFSLILGSALAQGPANRVTPLTLEDLLTAEGIQQPVLSPDGKWFALPWQGQIALVSTSGGWPIPLTTNAGGKNGLDWSPDGETLAYVSGGSIWSVPAAGGRPARLTDGERGAGDPRTAADRAPKWSPKGNWILFETGRKGNADLAVVSRDGRAQNLLSVSGADEGGAAWSPDGAHIAFVERSPDHFSGRLRVADFDETTGRLKDDGKVLYDAPADRGGGWSIRRIVWSPDGRQVAAILQESGWDKIYLIPVTGGLPRALTSGDGEDEAPAFSPDGKYVAFSSNRLLREERRIWLVSITGGTPRRLTKGLPGVERAPQWSPDGTKIYFTRNSALEPPSLAYATVEPATAAVHPLIGAQPRNLAGSLVPPPEVVHFPSRDGLEIAAILHKPVNFQENRRYPAVLWIHGGPEGQDTVGWDPWAVYLTQRGYLVLRPNYRGSSGYGERFRNLNVEDSGGGEVDDIEAGARFLVARGWADETRLAIGGGSHGGTMVAYAVTKRPGLFKAAIDLYGVVDRATFLERTNRNSAIRWARKMGGLPSEKPEVYRKANILPDVSRITAPLLIMHGEDDPQVPPYESQQFVAALKKAGKSYVYITYPKELHGFSQREHRLDAWRKQVAFLDRYLQPQFGRSITSTSDIVLDEK